MNRPSGIFTLSIFLATAMVGCEKTAPPFSADAVEPATGQINVNVLRGNGSASNVIVKAVDPSGNVFTTISDSNGMAIFNPVPFNIGNWTIEVPNQDYRCPNPNTQSVSIVSPSSSKSVSVQYGVYTNFSLSAPTITTLTPPFVKVSYNFTFSSQNDCGIPWTITFTWQGSNFTWTVGGSGTLEPGQSYSVNLISGQSVNLTFIESPSTTYSGTPWLISSPIGQTSNPSMVF